VCGRETNGGSEDETEMKRRAWLAWILGTAAALSGCAGAGGPWLGTSPEVKGKLQFEAGRAQQIAAMDIDQLDLYRVYFQGNFKRPRAVVLDRGGDDMRFVTTGWARARGGQAHRVVVNAVARKLRGAVLKSPLGRNIGYAMATERDDNFVTSFYFLRFDNDGEGPIYLVKLYRFKPMRAQGTDSITPSSY